MLWLQKIKGCSMTTIHTDAFLSISKYTNLAAGAISSVGELSRKALSFSKDINSYNINSQLSLTVFYTKTHNVDLSTTDRILDSDDRTWLQNVSVAFYNAIDGSGTQITKASLATTITNTYPAIKSITFDTEVTSSDNRFYYGYVRFVVEIMGVDRIYNLWCSNSVFENGFERLQTVVVPLFSNLEQYFQDPAIVVSNITTSDAYEHSQRVQTAIGSIPATGVNYYDFAYVNPNNPNSITNVKWAVIYYGNISSTDVIKTDIQKYLQDNSPRSRDQWKAIFPDIYYSTKFIVNPLWSDYSINNMIVGSSGVFKNNFTITTMLSRAAALFTDYSTADIAAKLHYMPMPFKSIGLLTMPGADNSVTRQFLDSVYTDIINVSTVSADFNRMSTKTQNMLLKLGLALTYAENFNSSTVLPSGLYRVNRLGVVCIGFNADAVEFIVTPKPSVAS